MGRTRRISIRALPGGNCESRKVWGDECEDVVGAKQRKNSTTVFVIRHGFLGGLELSRKVFADLLFHPQQILMVTVATALTTIGYEIEVYSLEDSPVHTVWKNIGVSVSIVEADKKIMIDRLNYDAILVNSLEAKEAISARLFILSNPND
ncbi:hypothetical protein L2E82_51054 [Cichorium intybus]|nr:hypothetical protein L2E82_51054 [Cichorium intybus]